VYKVVATQQFKYLGNNPLWVHIGDTGLVEHDKGGEYVMVFWDKFDYSKVDFEAHLCAKFRFKRHIEKACPDEMFEI
jgi:hypothetical protein